MDVNVHPAKTEVRFADERRIFDLVYRGARSAIAMGDRHPELQLSAKKPTNIFAPTNEFTQAKLNIPVVDTASFSPKNENKPIIEKTQIEASITPKTDFSKPLILNDSSAVMTDCKKINDAPIYKVILDDEFSSPLKPKADLSIRQEALSQPIIEKVEQILPENNDLAKPDLNSDINLEIDPLKIKYIGEAFATYIIVSHGESLYLIDKHAAHERINFEKLKAELEIQKQMLLTPVSVTLLTEEFEAIISNLTMLDDFGFEIEDFGDNTVIVRAVPAILGSDNISSLISEIAETLRISGQPMPQKIDDILHSIACKSAIKAGNITSKEELEKLAIKVLTSKSLMYCPHGRPITFELKRSQIEKQFGRLG